MKILVIGIVASGKTTLSHKLSKALNIPHFEIDNIVHNDKTNTKRTPSEQKKIIQELNKKYKSWIIEGTLRKNLNYLLDLADYILFLDIPLNIRKKRILTRYIKQVLKIEKTNYKPTIKMLQKMFEWTKTYEENKAQELKRLEKCKNKTIILKKADLNLALSKIKISR